MKKLFVLIASLVVLSLVGCSSISTSTDYDPEIDFTKYKTFMWYAGEMPADDELAKYPLVKKRMANSIAKSLATKGFTEGTEDNYDFVIVMHAGTKERMQVNTYGYGGYGYGGYGGYGGGGWGGGGMSTTDVNYYDEATVIVDIADAEKKELAWRGTATGIVRKSDKEQSEAQADADEVINKILADFPPGKEE